MRQQVLRGQEGKKLGLDTNLAIPGRPGRVAALLKGWHFIAGMDICNLI